MKVTLEQGYKWTTVHVVPEERSYRDPEFILDLPHKQVMDILEIQTKMEELQQTLEPLFKTATEAAKLRNDAEKAAKEAEEQPLDVGFNAERDFAFVDSDVKP